MKFKLLIQSTCDHAFFKTIDKVREITIVPGQGVPQLVLRFYDNTHQAMYFRLDSVIFHEEIIEDNSNGS
jgi:hypothetical protein